MKLIDEVSKSYTSMRSVARDLESHTKILSKSHPPVPLTNSKKYSEMLRKWFEYLKFEESNPTTLENKSLFAQRIVLCYEQALLVFPQWPQLWLGYLNFLTGFVESNVENPTLSEMVSGVKDQIANVFQRATEIFIPDCVLIYLAWTKFEEEFGTAENVHFAFNKCLNSSVIQDQTLVI